MRPWPAHLCAPRVQPRRPPRATICLALCALVLLSACSSFRQALSNKECRLEPGKPYEVVTIDLRRHAIKLLWKDEEGAPLLTFSRALDLLESRGDSVVALTNGGIFTRDYTPLGLYVEDGQMLVPRNLHDGYGNFYLKPNGIFLTDSMHARIVESSAFDAASPAPSHALQSGPLLLVGDAIHPAFRPMSTSCRLRSGIGVDKEGRIHLAISNGAVNFYDFAMLFKQVLGCDDALYLDGTLSVLYAPSQGRAHLPSTRYATFVAVVARQADAADPVAPPGFEPGTSWSRARRSAN